MVEQLPFANKFIYHANPGKGIRKPNFFPIPVFYYLCVSAAA